MKTHYSSSLCVLFALSMLFLPEAIVHGQRYSDLGKPAFVTSSNGTTNTIYIPNQDRFHQFKIYKKDKNDNQFHVVATIQASFSADKAVTPYSVTWTDEVANTQAVNYFIEAYDHNGSKICDMNIIWQAAKK